MQVHRGTCYMAGKRRRPVEREEARRLLADGTSACTHCRPDAGLGIIDLRQGLARTACAVRADPKQCDREGRSPTRRNTLRGFSQTIVPAGNR
ncbi:DUF6233 domain-containing protein [Streptomyces sp. NPDC001851]|uniref:DUF6233 domain-containing protein n=1 Tax=Streptomyces sp. NPDC001851 TaxID=3154529 RepID=UPI00331D6E7D